MAEGTLAKPKQGVAKMSEVSGNTGQVAGSNEKLKGGVYKHPQTGEEIIALDDPITGDAQARGYVRVGFEYVRDIKPGDVREVGISPSEDHAKQPERANEVRSSELEELRSRLAALEGKQAVKAEKKLQVDTATEESQKQAQDAAEQKVEERGTDNSGDVEASGGVNASTEAKESTPNKKEVK
jgi:hypothetical protein